MSTESSPKPAAAAIAREAIKLLRHSDAEPTASQIAILLEAAAAIQRGDGQTDDVKPRDLEQFKIETFRHAGNVIFNQLNEAGFLFGTAQGKEALFTAQRVADLIVHSPHSTALLNSSTPPADEPAAQLSETSGATPEIRYLSEGETILAGDECNSEDFPHSWQKSDCAGQRYRRKRHTCHRRRELAAVRKSAGAEGADKLAAIAANEWYPDSPSHAKNLAKVIRAHMEPLMVRTAAKSTPGVES